MTVPPRPIPPVKARHFPPPPPLAPKPTGLWRRTPPAIFPPMMGLFGLGLGWRVLAAQPGMSPVAPVSDVILGATALLYAFALIAWISKPLRRPLVVLEDLSVLPGRAGLAALALCLALLSAAIAPYQPTLALGIVVAALVALITIGMLIGWAMMTGPEEARVVTPVFHLSFAGYIMAPLSLIQLGYTGFSTGVLIATTAAAFAIWFVSLRQLIKRIPPAPLRPLLAIHLAPASLFSVVSAQLGFPEIAFGFALLALGILACLILFLRWILVAGFTPLWGALTFPLAASASASILSLGEVGLWIGSLLLFLATGFIPWVAMKILKSWASGQLAAKTNAATA